MKIIISSKYSLNPVSNEKNQQKTCRKIAGLLVILSKIS